MPNEQNLRPIQKGQLSKEELKRRQSNGGKKSVEKRRELKKLKELMEIVMQLPDEETEEQNAVAITKAIAKRAKKGYVDAYNAIRDILGEKPVDKQEIEFPVVNIIDY